MKVKVKIENLERTIEAEVGQDLRTALLENDVKLYGPKFLHQHFNCHGKGLCTTCQVEIVEGDGVCDQSFFERIRIGSEHRLACQARIYQDTVIRTLHETLPADS